ncbi:MAG TPA: arginyltransferase [Thioploca sp.]|nr:MAG: arginyltransferase [Gammaproteobacteria bacterium]HDN27917.1 arginyltransferase [Thioploca sp.]
MDNRTNCALYTTYPHECGYLPNRLATTVFVEPSVPNKNPLLYDELSQQGFRRSGERIYRPKCIGCQACMAVRLPVRQFTSRRSQRRVWQKNQDLTVSAALPTFKPQHYNLYRCYLAARHEGDGMDNPTPKSYMQFLTSAWSKTVFYEFHLKKQLLAVAVVDHIKTGLSAMYTFFDPNYPARSLGVYAVLWEIEETKRLNLDWLYLGYWIKDCRKMHYKTEYQPLEYFYQEKWQRLNNRELEIGDCDLGIGE